MTRENLLKFINYDRILIDRMPMMYLELHGILTESLIHFWMANYINKLHKSEVFWKSVFFSTAFVQNLSEDEYYSNHWNTINKKKYLLIWNTQRHAVNQI